MIGDLKVLGLIPARGGSRGVVRKNLREVGGKSLIARAVESARAADCVDRVVLSSDDPEIIQAAVSLGCEVPFIRPAELASDEATAMDVVRHALEILPEQYDLIVLLQPTSPFRSGADIDAAVQHCIKSGAPACVSVCAPAKPPQWSFALDARGRMKPIVPEHHLVSRRQDLPQAYDPNGAVFVARCDWIVNQIDFVSPETVVYIMPKERSLDIDSEFDLVLAEAVAAWLARGTEARAPEGTLKARPAAGRKRTSG